MNVKSSLCICLMLSILFVSFGFSAAEDLKTIQLPEPRIEGGRPLMEVLKDVLPQPVTIYLHAQLPAVAFYERYGFVKEGDIFYEANMAHYKMVYYK